MESSDKVERFHGKRGKLDQILKILEICKSHIKMSSLYITFLQFTRNQHFPCGFYQRFFESFCLNFFQVKKLFKRWNLNCWLNLHRAYFEKIAKISRTRTGNPEPCARKDCRNSKDCRTPGCLLNFKKEEKLPKWNCNLSFLVTLSRPKLNILQNKNNKLQPELLSFIYTET